MQTDDDYGDSAASVLYSTTVVNQGYALGFAGFDESNKEAPAKYYINNHLQIEFAYNLKNRIVEFNLKPLSVKHKFQAAEVDDTDPAQTPLQTCNARK